MANLMQLSQLSNDPPKIRRDLINQKINLDVANLKKRKLFAAVVEELDLPARKQKCFGGVEDSECDLLPVKAVDPEDVYTLISEGSEVIDFMDAPAESAQDSNSSLGDDAQSGNAEVKLEEIRLKVPYDEASTSWADSGSGKLRTGPFQAESSITSCRKDFEEEARGPKQNISWNNVNSMEECLTTEYCKDSGEETGEGLEEFLSSTGMDPDLFALSIGRSSVDQETPLLQHKPTIDQEFEQYFSMLML